MSTINMEMAGATLVEAFEFPVERGKIKEFSNAIMDSNRMYLDREYARSRGYGDVIAPVTYPVSVALHMPSENAVLEGMLKLGMDPAKSVHGEVEFKYERPIVAGESLSVTVTVGKIDRKEGKRGGLMTMVEIFFNYKDKNGKQVCTVKNLFIERG